MSYLDLLNAGLSSILGREVVQQDGGSYSVDDLYHHTYVSAPSAENATTTITLQTLRGTSVDLRVEPSYTVAQLKAAFQIRKQVWMDNIALHFSGQQLEDHQRLSYYNITHNSFVQQVQVGGGLRIPKTFDRNNLAPQYDYDLTDVTDDGNIYMRGGFVYNRPYGWKRFAVKVLGKYENDAWLGPDGERTDQAPGEWPVSYHGTNMSSANMIVKEGYQPGPRALYGKGIYSSPSLEMVERFYAKEFDHQGKTYKIALQNRVNPDQGAGHLEIIPASVTEAGADYWLSPAHNSDVRPYGILIREVPQSTF